MNFWQNMYEKLQTKLQATCLRVGNDIPYIPENGRYPDVTACTGSYGEGITWWTNGFWGGLMWQMYNATGDECYKTAAQNVENRLDEALAEKFLGLHHDVGFQWLHTSVANYRLTQDADSRRRGLHAAFILAGRYNPSAKFIRAWNGNQTGRTIVDTMMNLPLLHWAGKELDDPRFAFIANTHADTAMEVIIRPDGSCNHIVDLCPVTGEFIANPAGQGYESGSSWSRGQAWALYGFALNHFYSKDEKYLHAAKRVAHYFIAQLAMNNWLPLVDFRAPAEPVRHDTSAAMCAVCGLLEIAEHVPELEKNFYLQAAEKITRACEERFANWETETDGIMYGGTAAYHSSRDLSFETSLIYGDYFFTEAVLRMAGKGFRIW